MATKAVASNHNRRFRGQNSGPSAIPMEIRAASDLPASEVCTLLSIRFDIMVVTPTVRALMFQSPPNEPLSCPTGVENREAVGLRNPVGPWIRVTRRPCLGGWPHRL